MRTYLDLVKQVLDHGEPRADRTGVGTLSLFGMQSRYDLREGFPLVTTKKVLFPAVVRELLWFLGGCTNIHDQDLTKHTPIWDAWADETGELGPIYGHQWRHWGAAGKSGGIDQIQQLIDDIRRDPTSRRLIVNAWNVADVPRMRLPPCHLLVQFYVTGSGLLNCQLYQRSADLALGVPFNVASYALLTHLIAAECDLTPGFFVHTMGDAHVYKNHVDGLRIQLQRDPLPLPRIRIAKKPLFELGFDDIVLEGYQHHPFIKFAVAV